MNFSFASRGILSFFLLVSLVSPGYAAPYRFANDSSLSKLRQEFGHRKKIPPEFEAEILKALSFFPELKKNKIHFVLRKGHAPLSAQPTFAGIFRNATKRKYKVFISTKVKGEWEKFNLKNTPYDARVGVLGHEITHVKNFAQMSGLSLIGLGINHVSKSYMNRFEYRTDSMCIAQGMGEYLLASAIFARQIFNAPDPEQLNVTGVRANYKERYMSPATIRLYMSDLKEKETSGKLTQ